MKRKVLSLVLGVAMTAALVAGCGNSGSTGTTSAPADTNAAQSTGNETANSEAVIESNAQSVADAVKETLGTANGEGKKVGMTVPSIGNDFMLALTDAMQAAIEETGAEVQFDSAENNVTTQISQIENDITMGCDILVVWAVNGDGVANACQAAVEQGIPVLAFAYEIPGATCSVISATDEDMGTACAQMASDWIDENYADAADGEVKVFVMTSSTTPESVIRSDAILNTIKENSKVTVVEAEVTDQDKTDAARTLAENTLLANPDTDVIICMNGTCGVGTESYVMSSGSPIEDKSKFAIFCVDETDEIISKIQSSVNNESVLRGTVSMGSIDFTVSDFMKAMTPLLNDEEPVSVDGAASVITPDTL